MQRLKTSSLPLKIRQKVPAPPLHLTPVALAWPARPPERLQQQRARAAPGSCQNGEHVRAAHARRSGKRNVKREVKRTCANLQKAANNCLAPSDVAWIKKCLVTMLGVAFRMFKVVYALTCIRHITLTKAAASTLPWQPRQTRIQVCQSLSLGHKQTCGAALCHMFARVQPHGFNFGSNRVQRAFPRLIVTHSRLRLRLGGREASRFAECGLSGFKNHLRLVQVHASWSLCFMLRLNTGWPSRPDLRRDPRHGNGQPARGAH